MVVAIHGTTHWSIRPIPTAMMGHAVIDNGGEEYTYSAFQVEADDMGQVWDLHNRSSDFRCSVVIESTGFARCTCATYRSEKRCMHCEGMRFLVGVI